MPIVKRKPTSPGRRFVISVVNPDLHKGAPFAALVEKKSKNGGRNNNGRITVRHQGGGHKQHYRIVDFKRDKDGIAASVGEVSNSEHNLRSLGKAGASRWRGIRPTVRGVVMNPVDHPHGGGEGRTSGGRHPVSPWGTPTKGYKTRKNKRTDGLIVRHRNKK